jgi:hypothetical protein
MQPLRQWKDVPVILNATRTSLASSFALALIVAGAALAPVSAQTKTWPAGTDCTKLVGNDKTDCANQAKNSASPDNSNNPDNAQINNTKNGTAAPTTSGGDVPASNDDMNYQGKDCAALTGNSKEECARQNKQMGEPDNSNNPAKSDPAQSN